MQVATGTATEADLTTAKERLLSPEAVAIYDQLNREARASEERVRTFLLGVRIGLGIGPNWAFDTTSKRFLKGERGTTDGG